MIHIPIHVRRIRCPLKPIRINCPSCQVRDVAAQAWDEIETINWIFRQTTSWVRCGACGVSLYSRERAESLIGRTPAQLECVVVWHVSFALKFLTVMACIFCAFPGLGLMVAIAALMTNLVCRTSPGWRRASIVAVSAALIANAAYLVLILLVPTH